MYGPNDGLHSDKSCLGVIIALIVIAAGLYAVI